MRPLREKRREKTNLVFTEQRVLTFILDFAEKEFDFIDISMHQIVGVKS